MAPVTPVKIIYVPIGIIGDPNYKIYQEQSNYYSDIPYYAVLINKFSKLIR